MSNQFTIDCISKEPFDDQMNLLLITKQETTHHFGKPADKDKEECEIKESFDMMMATNSIKQSIGQNLMF